MVNLSKKNWFKGLILIFVFPILAYSQAKDQQKEMRKNAEPPLNPVSEASAPAQGAPNPNDVKPGEGKPGEQAATAESAATKSKWSYWGGVIVGKPNAGVYKGIGYGFSVGADQTVRQDLLRVGVFLNSVVASASQSYSYDLTGYSLTRNYKLTSTAFGGRVTIELKDGYRLVGDIGMGYTNSELSSVTTDAPAVIGVNVGTKLNSGWDSVYAIGIQKEWQTNRTFYGIELGNMVRGAKTEDGIKEFYLQGFCRYH